MNSIREIQKINDEELRLGIAGTKASWHEKYAQSAWVYVGNLDKELTEGDVIAVLSQWGELEDLHLVRDDEQGGTGESRGFAFGKYEDARSCVLAVDNFCGVVLCGRSLRVDHVENYRLPKHLLEKEDEEKKEQQQQSAVVQPGHAYQEQELANEYSLQHGQDLFAPSTATAAETKKETARPTTSQQLLKKKKKESKKKERSDDNDSRKAKKRRKEERRQRKEQKKAEHEEKRRRRRARKLIKQETNDDDDDDDDHSDKDARRQKPKKQRGRENDGTDDERGKHRRRHDS